MKLHKKSFGFWMLALALIVALSACQPAATTTESSASVAESTSAASSEAASSEVASSEVASSEQPAGNGTGVFEGKARGFAGDVVVKVTLDNSEIKAVEVEAKDETPTIGGTAIDSLKDMVVKAQSTQLDVVAGATVTSKAFIEATNAALTAGGVDPTKLVPKEVEAEKLELNQEADIVVVGAGGAGLTSAITAAEAGQKVIVLEKAAGAGGNTNRATGGMNAAETHYQKEQQIEDTIQTYIEDTMKGGHNLNNPELVRVMAENSAKAIDWLDTIDAKLSDVGFAGGATNARAHRPVDENDKVLSVGTFLVDKLLKRAEAVGVKVIYGAKVNEVLMADGKAAGVTAETKDGALTVKAKAVIVASGGFGGSDAKVSEYRPDLQGYVSTNAPTIEGDAIDFLKKVNANFIDMDKIQTHPTVVQKDGSLISESLRGDGAILLNKEGKRFIDEMETRDTVSAAINKQTEKTAWLIADNAMFEKSNVVKGYVNKGLLTKVDDLKALAAFIGADEATVAKTLADWTSYVKAGEDKEFGHKNMDKLDFDLSVAPFYVGPVGPGIHHTMGGVEINTNAEIISTDKAVIPGLFAAGEVTGGVHGGNRLGGNAVTDIVVFGRIAGENAVKYVGK